jgi:hypothetical protein
MATADVDHGIEPCYFPGPFALSGAAREFPLALSGGWPLERRQPCISQSFLPGRTQLARLVAAGSVGNITALADYIRRFLRYTHRTY